MEFWTLRRELKRMGKANLMKLAFDQKKHHLP